MTMIQANHRRAPRTAIRLLAAGALFVAGTSAWALEPFNAEYRASYMGMQATGNMTLERNGQD